MPISVHPAARRSAASVAPAAIGTMLDSPEPLNCAGSPFPVLKNSPFLNGAFEVAILLAAVGALVEVEWATVL